MSFHFIVCFMNISNSSFYMLEAVRLLGRLLVITYITGITLPPPHILLSDVLLSVLACSIMERSCSICGSTGNVSKNKCNACGKFVYLF